MGDFSKFSEWAFKALVGGGVGLVVWHLKEITRLITSMKVELARFAERGNWLKEKIENHEIRITKLEENKHARR